MKKKLMLIVPLVLLLVAVPATVAVVARHLPAGGA